jgi:hypothetical protein
MSIEAMKQALDALETHAAIGVRADKAIAAINKALAQPKPVQVSPLDFVTMTLEKEHLVGRPIIWAQWPNEEKNT